MNKNEAIYEFARDYILRFMDPLTDHEEILFDFPQDMRKLGFVYDKGEAFINATSRQCFYSHELLDDVTRINDADTLTSGLMSHWRYIINTSGDWRLFVPEERAWFLSVLWRLAEVTEPDGDNPFIFTGRPVKMKIRTRLPIPERGFVTGDEMSQTLTFDNEGTVYLRRTWKGKEEGFPAVKTFKAKVDKETARAALVVASEWFRTGYSIPISETTGLWSVDIENKKGKHHLKAGPVLGDLPAEDGGGVSAILRKLLGNDELFCFDGNPDAIARVTLQVRTAENVRFENGRPVYAKGERRREILTVDVEQDKITLERSIKDSGSSLMKIKTAPGEISYCLRDIDPAMFNDIEGNPEDTEESPIRRTYRMIIQTRRQKMYVVTGDYDEKGLPREWDAFIRPIRSLFKHYGIPRLADQVLYERKRRRKGEYIYCHVKFIGGSRKHYAYLADDDVYQPGDLVIVPAGRENKEKIVRICGIQYADKENAPYPFRLLKTIIRKCTPKDAEAFLEKYKE